MITVEEALKIVLEKTIPTTKREKLEVKLAMNRVLAGDVLSPIDMPPFPQSAMDGYAVNYQNDSPITLLGEVAAGQFQNFTLQANEAVRIFTGAEVPETTNMVIRQEDVTITDQGISVSKFPNKMSNIRLKGEQILKGETALEKGHLINEASIAFLTSIGVKFVEVYHNPKVLIISTGDELVSAGEVLEPGQIYESNSIMLEATLHNRGYTDTKIIKIKDDYDQTSKTIHQSLTEFDLILCSGGISVGDYDFIGKALIENGVTPHFYKVKQKPGKPLFFGQKDHTFVFGLPGNPAACLTGFYIYVLPFLNKFKGGSFIGLSTQEARLCKDYIRKGNRAEFLKSRVNNGEVEILEGQSSAMLKSFALANAIAYMPISKPVIRQGEFITIYRLSC